MIHYMTTHGVQNPTVANELRSLRKHGIEFRLHALRRPESSFFASPDIARIERETHYLYPSGLLHLVSSALMAVFVFRQRLLRAMWNAFTGPRESLWIRLKAMWHLLVAVDWAMSLRKSEVSLVHSQWIHSGGTVAMYGAWLLDVPFSFTGHAADLFRDRAVLEDKIRRAAFIICISTFHRQFFLSQGAKPEQLVIAYCGIDCDHFHPSQADFPGPPRILSSGRLVEKKGFPYLIEACRILKDRGVIFQCVIGGDGDLEEELNRAIESGNLGDCVRVTGQPLMQEEMPDFMRTGSVYCLPCVRASDNDIDGLPQMLMEAMACALPVVSTRLVGIPDLVIDRRTGLLVDPENPPALADALQELLDDPGLADQLAAAGREHVIHSFNIDTAVAPLVKQFRLYLDARHAPAAVEQVA